MKNTLTILILVLSFAINSSVFAQCDSLSTPIQQGFEMGLNDWTLVDNNGAVSWSLSSDGTNSGDSSLFYGWDGTLPADDYAFSKCLSLDSGKTYEVSFYSRGRSSTGYYDERLRVVLSTDTTAASVIDTLVEIDPLNNTTHAQTKVSFTNNTGQFHIGFHACSDADLFGLYLDDISIKEVNPFEAGIIDLEGLDGGCNADTADIDISFTNNGTDSITTLDVIVMVNGAMHDTLNFTPNPAMAPGDTGYVNTMVNMSAYGEYEVEAILSLAGDSDPSNDTIADATVTWGEYNLNMYDYNMGFESGDSSETNKLTLIDNNNDGDYSYGNGLWGLYYYTGPDTATNDYMLGYKYDFNNDADDWLMTSCFDLDSSEQYVLNIDAKQYSNIYPEDLIVMMGYDNSVAAMTDTLIANATLDTAWMTLSDTFNVDYSGTYYFGFKANSAADHYYLYIDNINISMLTTVGLGNNTSKGIAIYPNPASDHFIIELNNEITSEVSIYNVTGKLINNIRSNGNTMINTKDWSKGIYFINIENSLGTQQHKLIVE
jgi:hypothetical protein